MNEETVNNILAIVEEAFGNLSFEYSNFKERVYVEGKEEFIAEIKTELEKLKHNDQDNN